MSDNRLNQNINWTPDRLNRQPTVYRGMTFVELLIVILIGAAIGAVVGLIVMIIVNLGWYSIPAGMLVFGVLSVRFGGIYISRLKRGKPETWFEQYIEFRLAPGKLITQEQLWGIHRTLRAKNKSKRKDKKDE